MYNIFSDIDECSAGTHNCNDPLNECVNFPGGFKCVCISGYEGDGITCTGNTKHKLIHEADPLVLHVLSVRPYVRKSVPTLQNLPKQN